MGVGMSPELVCFLHTSILPLLTTHADHKGIRTTGADFVTNDRHRNNIDIVVETLVDKINFEEKNGQLEATGVTLVDKTGSKREVKATKEIIVSGGDRLAESTL